MRGTPSFSPVVLGIARLVAALAAAAVVATVAAVVAVAAATVVAATAVVVVAVVDGGYSPAAASPAVPSAPVAMTANDRAVFRSCCRASKLWFTTRSLLLTKLIVFN